MQIYLFLVVKQTGQNYINYIIFMITVTVEILYDFNFPAILLITAIFGQAQTNQSIWNKINMNSDQIPNFLAW